MKKDALYIYILFLSVLALIDSVELKSLKLKTIVQTNSINAKHRLKRNESVIYGLQLSIEEHSLFLLHEGNMC